MFLAGGLVLLGEGFRMIRFDVLDHWEPLQALYQRSPEFFRCTGTQPAAEQDWLDLPSGKGRADVLALGGWRDGRLDCYCEVLRGYPEAHFAYLGLLLVAEDCQGEGLGRLLWEQVCERLDWPEVTRWRLAVVDSNAQAVGFWRRLGFVETGERKPYLDREVILMERPRTIA